MPKEDKQPTYAEQAHDGVNEIPIPEVQNPKVEPKKEEKPEPREAQISKDVYGNVSLDRHGNILKADGQPLTGLSDEEVAKIKKGK